MTNEEKIKYNEMTKIIKAMAHPSRLFIIDKLKEKSYCVKELTELIEVDISTVSKHLALLKKTGLIYDEKRGNCIYYHLRCGCILEFYHCVINVVNNSKY